MTGGDSVLLQCLILLQSPLDAFLAKAEEQKGNTPQCAWDFHASAHIMFANVPVAQACHVAESRLTGGEELGPSMPSVCHIWLHLIPPSPLCIIYGLHSAI